MTSEKGKVKVYKLFRIVRNLPDVNFQDSKTDGINSDGIFDMAAVERRLYSRWLDIICQSPVCQVHLALSPG